jgi:eukaryotic-like serine/threonine-protein kinase
MAAVHHDHIAAIYQVGEEKGVPFIAMEFFQGTPLDKWLKQGHKPTVAQVLRIGREIAEALAAAHALGLIHRDVKPGNIWLDSSHGERVKILDFGLVCAATDDVRLTHAGAVLGTPAYMAPEQARAEKVDARSDLFSLGCVLYRLCSGALPFSGDTTMSLLTALAIDRPKPPRDLNAQVPVELSDLVMSLLEKDPARRPASAQEVVRAIRRLESRLAGNQDSHDTAAAPTPHTPPVKVPQRLRRPLVVGAAVALLLGGLIAGAAALIRIQTPQGDYVIDTDDSDFSFRVQDGAVQLEDHKNHKAYTLKVVKQDKDAKEVEMEVGDGGEFVFKTKTFTIKRGEKAIVTAWFEPRIGGVSSAPKAGDDWVKQMAALPAEKQVEATAAKLKELNPGFDGKMLHVTQDGVVKRLDFSTEQVTDVSPLRALIGLRVLGANLPVGSDGWTKGRLADLSPLENLKLTALYLQGTQVLNLSPLKGMPLTALNLHGTRVSDLSPLKGAPLADFNCAETAVSDLSPLEGAPLTKLYLVGTKISDLSPLKGMKLTRLNFGFTGVSDLSPLEGMPLTDLTFDNTAVTDLTPLKGMALKQLRCDFNSHRDAAVLRSMPTLEEINGIPAAEFWKGVNGK